MLGKAIYLSEIFYSCRLSDGRIMGVGRTKLILHYDLARRKYVGYMHWVVTKNLDGFCNLYHFEINSIHVQNYRYEICTQ